MVSSCIRYQSRNGTHPSVSIVSAPDAPSSVLTLPLIRIIDPDDAIVRVKVRPVHSLQVNHPDSDVMSDLFSWPVFVEVICTSTEATRM